MKVLEDHEGMSDDELARLVKDKENREFYDLLRLAFEAEILSSLPPDYYDVDKAWKEFTNRYRKSDSYKFRFPRLAAALISVIVALAAVAVGIGYTLKDRRYASSRHSNPEVMKSAKVSGPKINAESGISEEGTQIAERETHIFENESLASILEDMTKGSHISIVYENEEKKGLRLYFVWNRKADLRENLDRLNSFDRISIEFTGNKIIVK